MRLQLRHSHCYFLPVLGSHLLEGSKPSGSLPPRMALRVREMTRVWFYPEPEHPAQSSRRSQQRWTLPAAIVNGMLCCTVTSSPHVSRMRLSRLPGISRGCLKHRRGGRGGTSLPQMNSRSRGIHHSGGQIYQILAFDKSAASRYELITYPSFEVGRNVTKNAFWKSSYNLRTCHSDPL